MPAPSAFTMPFVNPTSSGTIALLAVVLVLVTLVEAKVLHWRIRELRFSQTLLRSAAWNLASGVVGWLVAVASCGDSELVVAPALLAGMLILIIPAVEIPLLVLFYRRNRMGWRRAAALGLAANAISTAAAVSLLVLLKICLGWILGNLDDRDRGRWQRPEMLDRTSGWILVPEPAPELELYTLRSFDVKIREWRTLPNCTLSDPNRWDSRGNLAALPVSGSGPEDSNLIRVVSLPECQEQVRLDPSGWLTPDPGSVLGICDVAIAPDLSRVAVLVRVGEVVARRDETSHFQLGSRCLLVVVNLPDGTVQGKSPRLAIDAGVTWMSNSLGVVFTSLHDDSIFSTNVRDLKGSREIRLEPSTDVFAKDLVAFEPVTGRVQTMYAGEYPLIVPAKTAMLLRGYKKLNLFGLLDRISVDLPIRPLVPGTVSISPDGDFLLVPVAHRNPLELPAAMLTIVSLQEPEQRHFVGEGTIFRSVWIEAPRQNQGRD